MVYTHVKALTPDQQLTSSIKSFGSGVGSRATMLPSAAGMAAAETIAASASMTTTLKECIAKVVLVMKFQVGQISE